MKKWIIVPFLFVSLSLFAQTKEVCITLEKALTDEAYREEITRYSDWGISWIDRWALSQGKKGDFFAGDPATPDYVVKLAE